LPFFSRVGSQIDAFDSVIVNVPLDWRM